MKYIFTFLFAFTALLSFSQEISTRKIVLSNDSIGLYNKMVPATRFGPSYFLCLQEYSKSFSNESFNSLIDNLKKQHPDIIALKAVDNKSVICIIPKHAMKGIYNFHDFISSNFDPQLLGHITSKQIVHIQVVPEYDPANKEEEKGFKGFN